MAIAIEFANVIARKTAIESKYPGGIDEFVKQRIPNFCEDEHLLRVGFMGTGEACNLMMRLEELGVSSTSEMALVTSDDCPSWLTGEVDGNYACWSADHPPGALVKYDLGFLLRCPTPACNSYAALADIVVACGAISNRKPNPNYPRHWCLRCTRNSAAITIEVYADLNEDNFAGLSAIRDFTRRSFFSEDTALLRDLEAALRSAGADDLRRQ